jgi:hypothetical protein
MLIFAAGTGAANSELVEFDTKKEREVSKTLADLPASHKQDKAGDAVDERNDEARKIGRWDV